eukprot:g15752.t1
MALKKLLRRRKKQQTVAAIQRFDTEAEELDGLDRGTRKILNLLNYTKRSGSAFDGLGYDVGYHSFNIAGHQFRGQRDPTMRFAKVNFDFAGKTVLDIGCNQGGMIHEIAGDIQHGVGIDYDARMINVANRIRAYNKSSNTDFYVFNLEEEDLNLITDLLPTERVDICFLLSVCMWIANWQQVIDFCADISDHLLFETNGKADQQQAQIDYLESRYGSIAMCSETSDDDPGQPKRKLLLCSDPRRA